MQKIKQISLLIVTALTTVLFLLPSLAFAAQQPQSNNSVKNDLQCGIDAAAGSQGCSPDAGAGKTLDQTIAQIINLISIIAGIIAVIMIIIGALRYVTSSGNEQAVTAAKKTLLYAVIGLIIVALAQIIVRFVLKRVTN